MMTQREAVALIEAWIKQHSPFTAQVVNATHDERGTWIIQVECSEIIWQQTIDPEGEISAPVLLN
jgi:hypothetical protein